MKLIYKLIPLVGFLMYLFTSCDDALNSCRSQSERTLNIGFYTAHHNTTGVIIEADTTLDSVSIYPISMPDSLLYHEASVTNISLPLSQFADTGIFIIKHKVLTNSLKVDTIMVVYQRIRTFASYKCGYYTNFNISMLHSSLEPTADSSKTDSILSIKTNISYEGNINYKIYFHNSLFAN